MAKPAKNAVNVPALALRAIYIRHAELLVADDFDPTLPGQKLTGNYKIVDGGKIEQLEFVPDDKTQPPLHLCRFHIQFMFTYLRGENSSPEDIANDNIAASVSARISVEYSAPGDRPDMKFLEAWGGSNALLHAWPYWREYCQSSFSRMNLPTVLLPLLRVEPHPKP